MIDSKVKYIVKEKIQETKNVVTLKLSCDAGVPEYKAGQFITVFFDDTGNAEGKSYTISSEPSEATLNITVKDMGQFSHKLSNMNIGDIVEASLPYGYFYSEGDNATLVMIAGGIGVTPFRSMIADSLKNNPSRKLILFYSNKTTDNIVFENEFEDMQKNYPNFVVKNYITQEENLNLCHPRLDLGSRLNEFKIGRIKVTDILEETKDIKDKEFLICGGIPFVRDFWKGLKEGGVPEETICTEAFF